MLCDSIANDEIRSVVALYSIAMESLWVLTTYLNSILHDTYLLSRCVCVEVIRPYVLPKHGVVIQVDELLGEPWYLVDVGLDGRGAEARQVRLVLENFL